MKRESTVVLPSRMFALCVYRGIMRVSRNYGGVNRESIDFSRIFDIDKFARLSM